jgi:hypothetical protein
VKNASRLGCDHPKERELLCGEVDLAVAQHDVARDRIDGEFACLSRPRAPRSRRAPQNRVDASSDLRGMERLTPLVPMAANSKPAASVMNVSASLRLRFRDGPNLNTSQC